MTNRTSLAAAVAKATANQPAPDSFVHGVGFVKAGVAATAAVERAAAPAAPKQQRVRELKRPPTDGDVVAEAIQFFNDLVAKADADGSVTKVQYVRALAKWPEGSKKPALQRRDVFDIVAMYPELEIAPATISTQFQFARSGKAKQNV